MLERIKNVFRRNKMQKFVALISSVALWFFVMDTQNPTIKGTYEVPVTMTNTPPNFKALYREEIVRVKLSAPRSYFIDYGVNNIRAQANLQNYSAEGDYEVPIEASYPKGFEIESLTPNTIYVKLDPFIEKQMKADVILTGSPMVDSVVSGTTKSSESITLIGPKTFVNRVTRVIGYIGLNGNGESFDILVPMTAIDEDGREVRGVRVAPSVITVNVQIESEVHKKIVPVIADVTLPEGREIAEIIMNPSTVEITGRTEIVEEIDSIKTEPLNFVVNTKTFVGKLKLIVPNGIKINKREIDVTCKFKE